jgi:hypothetical protein
LAKACTEAIWIRRLLSDLGFKQKITNIFCDNQSAIAISTSSKHHDRSKHIDVKYHYIKDQILSAEVEITHISTEDMTADILTKGFHRGLHQKHTSALGLVASSK